MELSPAYDLLNSTIVLRGADTEELALTLADKKRKITRELLVDYYGKDRLKLSDKTIDKVLNDIKSALPEWFQLLSICFLSSNSLSIGNQLFTNKE